MPSASSESSLSSRRSMRGWLYLALVGLVFVAYGLGCFRGIANYWQFGHNGYNGATYVRAAVNSLRFGLWGQVKYYQGFTPPPTDKYFVHHPLMLHLHLVPLVGLLGDEPWVGRLVPAFYSLGNLALLFALLRRYWGRVEALAGSVIYLLLPINLVYANMIDHVQGAIFGCLLAVWVYFRWRETLERRYFWGMMGAITIAAQWEWVGYLLALVLVIHAFACGLRRERPWQWQPEYSFVVVFSVVVLANAAAFFGYAYQVHGGLEALIDAFNRRSDPPTNYWSTVWSYTKVHYGLIPAGVLGAWVGYLGVRLLAGRLYLRDLLAFSFLFVQIVWSVMFPDSGSTHSYWIYYAGVAVAVGGAELVGALFRGLERPARRLAALWKRRRRSREATGGSTPSIPALQVAMLLALLAVPLGAQASFAWTRNQIGVERGAVPKYSPYDPRLDEARWARELGRRYRRGTARFLRYPGLGMRTEVKYYLNAPVGRRRTLSPLGSQPEEGRARVFLVDLKKVSDRAKLNELVRGHRSMVFDRRFLAVELTEPGGDFSAAVWRDREPGLLWTWFVNGQTRPGRWVADPLVESVDDLFGPLSEVGPSFAVGGDGGRFYEWHCPVGTVIRGFDLAPDGVVSGLRPRCGPADAGGGEASRARRPLLGPFWNRRSTDARRSLECPPGEVVVGIHGRAGSLVDAFGITCGGISEPRSDDLRKVGPIGGKGGESFDHRCPAGEAAWLFGIRIGGSLDRVEIGCRGG